MRENVEPRSSLGEGKPGSDGTSRGVRGKSWEGGRGGSRRGARTHHIRRTVASRSPACRPPSESVSRTDRPVERGGARYVVREGGTSVEKNQRSRLAARNGSEFPIAVDGYSSRPAK